jgi:hypothetical protein
MRERFVVTTKDGAAFSGVLYSEDGKALALRDAEAIGAGDNKANVPLDGEIIVLLADVAYLQRP